MAPAAPTPSRTVRSIHTALKVTGLLVVSTTHSRAWEATHTIKPLPMLGQEVTAVLALTPKLHTAPKSVQLQVQAMANSHTVALPSSMVVHHRIRTQLRLPGKLPTDRKATFLSIRSTMVVLINKKLIYLHSKSQKLATLVNPKALPMELHTVPLMVLPMVIPMVPLMVHPTVLLTDNISILHTVPKSVMLQVMVTVQVLPVPKLLTVQKSAQLQVKVTVNSLTAPMSQRLLPISLRHPGKPPTDRKETSQSTKFTMVVSISKVQTCLPTVEDTTNTRPLRTLTRHLTKHLRPIMTIKVLPLTPHTATTRPATSRRANLSTATSSSMVSSLTSTHYSKTTERTRLAHTVKRNLKSNLGSRKRNPSSSHTATLGSKSMNPNSSHTATHGSRSRSNLRSTVASIRASSSSRSSSSSRELRAMANSNQAMTHGLHLRSRKRRLRRRPLSKRMLTSAGRPVSRIKIRKPRVLETMTSI